jgi:hypothetical protein
MFFKAVDEVLGNTKYFVRFGKNQNSVATMMILMAHIACLHSIGVLVIDEAQHNRSGSGSGSRSRSRSFTTGRGSRSISVVVRRRRRRRTGTTSGTTA